MKQLTIAVTSHITSVYLVEVADDFDTDNPDALQDLALSDGALLLSQTTDADVRIRDAQAL